MYKPIDLASKLDAIQLYWQPHTVSEFNGHDVMVVKVKGEFNWHVHPDTDDFFLVIKGALHIDLETESTVTLTAGQMFVVPRGVRHRPRAVDEVHLMLIEPRGTPNTGDVTTAAPRRVI